VPDARPSFPFEEVAGSDSRIDEEGEGEIGKDPRNLTFHGRRFE
jgi:hypothetical protein